MRYIVGRGASIVINLRRHLPQTLFERLYFGGQLRRLQQAPARPVAEDRPEPAATVTP
jgi:hypothetical protein